MNLEQLLTAIKTQPMTVEFYDVMDVIAENYQYSDTTFSNADIINEAGTNHGSCKIFAFAKLQNLDNEQTLACFGQYYRNDVLNNPEGDDHGNIRRFMIHGWSGISFSAEALTAHAEELVL